MENIVLLVLLVLTAPAWLSILATVGCLLAMCAVQFGILLVVAAQGVQACVRHWRGDRP